MPNKQHSKSKTTTEAQNVFISHAHKDTLRREFSNRLSAALAKKNWTQSDLAREAAKHSSDKKFGRDLVSGYVRGKYMPHPLHLEAIAKALGMEKEILLPAANIARKGEPNPPQDLRALGDGRASLRINQIVDMNVALKVLKLLNDEAT